MLIVTNGQAGLDAIAATGVVGDRLAWNDVLHDGPVPPGSLEDATPTRAAFIGSWGGPGEDVVLRGFRTRDERLRRALRDGETIVLWFEHDLYDQLQLLQVGAAVNGEPALTSAVELVQMQDYISLTDVETLARGYVDRRRLDHSHLGRLNRAWDAFTSPTPEALVEWTRPDPDFVCLPAAITRLLEELPWERSGLSRTESQILRAIERNPISPWELFRAVQTFEPAIFMGDASFWQVLLRLAAGRPRALTLECGVPNRNAALPEGRVSLTAEGHASLAGDLDWQRATTTERWLGGTRLVPGPAWRWVPRDGRVLFA